MENLFDENLYSNQLKFVGLTNSSLDFKMSFLNKVVEKWQGITNGNYDILNIRHNIITKELINVLNIILNSLLSVAGLSKVLESIIEFKDFTIATITFINNQKT